MNTHGHESVASTAGVPLLKQTFAALGSKTPRLAAFYFGNWLADVSQLVDPVATGGGVIAAKEFIDRTIDELISTTFFKRADELLRLACIVDLGLLVERLKAHLYGAMDYYILAGNDTRRSELAQLVRLGFRIKGYFKFAHPPAPGQPPPMNTDAFFQIFDRMFTQYYPHEHLDRPEVLPSKQPPEYAADKDTGTRATHQALQPDLYRYLRDDLEIIAGLLSEVDLDWACKTFGPTGVANDNDLDWNLGLSKLGRALHGMEDFFAHSNFIEHAALVMGQQFIPWSFQDVSPQ
jgi:hypothetical protein